MTGLTSDSLGYASRAYSEFRNRGNEGGSHPQAVREEGEGKLYSVCGRHVLCVAPGIASALHELVRAVLFRGNTMVAQNRLGCTRATAS